MIPTAEEQAQKFMDTYPKYGNYLCDNDKIFITKLLKEFAKLHVQAQQEALLKKAKVKITGNAWFQKSKVDKDSIKNAYPLTNVI